MFVTLFNKIPLCFSPFPQQNIPVNTLHQEADKNGPVVFEIKNVIQERLFKKTQRFPMQVEIINTALLLFLNTL